MNILVINSGSSSIKYQLLGMPAGERLAAGVIEAIGTGGHHRFSCGDEPDKQVAEGIADHSAGLHAIMATLENRLGNGGIKNLQAIGHRVVHGGEYFREPTLIDTAVIAKIRDANPLAPLHNPANLLGIEVALDAAPQLPQVAVFDTAFHSSLPDYAYHYALPQTFYRDYRVRRYGFHGTSHSYVSREAAGFMERPLDQLRLITLHLGNGASAAAIRDGACVDTTMGMTPLEGLVMGTRCGDIDPSIPFYITRQTGLDMDRVEDMLNRESGLKGLCGTHDMREVHRLADSGDASAQLALNMVYQRLKKTIGAFIAVLGGLDALVFTGGIGENDRRLRAAVCTDLEQFGFAMDAAANESGRPGNHAIQVAGSSPAILVIPTNEEYEIARQTLDCVQGS